MEDKTKKMKLWEHLEELRFTLFKILGVLCITTALSFYFIDDIFHTLMKPVYILKFQKPEFNVDIIYTTPFEPVFITMKLAFLGGLILGLPAVILFIWSFISPGLRKKEKSAFYWFCAAGTLSFVVGVILGYLIVPTVLEMSITLF